MEEPRLQEQEEPINHEIEEDQESSSEEKEDDVIMVDDDDESEDDDEETAGHPRPPSAAIPSNNNNNSLLHNNDPTMLLTPAERTWARELKRCVEEDEDLHALPCDFEYAQWAIITQGDQNLALKRIATIQAFRQNYKIDHSMEQGVFYINALMEQQPGFVLNLNVDLARQESINAFDCGMFQPKVAMGCSASPASSAGGILDNWQICIGGIYYLKYSCQPSFAVIRNGFLELVDFCGYDWENFSLEAQERLFGELLGDYPMFERHLLAYNTGYIANVGFGLAKKLLPRGMLDSVQLGCRVIENDETRNPTKRLCEFYLQPSLPVAQLNLLERAKILIAMRQHNEAVFRLES